MELSDIIEMFYELTGLILTKTSSFLEKELPVEQVLGIVNKIDTTKPFQAYSLHLDEIEIESVSEEQIANTILQNIDRIENPLDYFLIQDLYTGINKIELEENENGDFYVIEKSYITGMLFYNEVLDWCTDNMEKCREYIKEIFTEDFIISQFKAW